MSKKIPQVRQTIGSLLSEEDSRITKKKLLGLGVAGVFAGIALASAEHHGENILDFFDHAVGHTSSLWNSANQ